MENFTFTISGRPLDGFIATLNDENGGRETPRTLEEFVLAHVNALGRSMADAKKLGQITAAEFIRRLTLAEYSAILTAAETDVEVAGLVQTLIESPIVVFDDPRLVNGLALLVQKTLLEESRISALTAYARPIAPAVEQPE